MTPAPPGRYIPGRLALPAPNRRLIGAPAGGGLLRNWRRLFAVDAALRAGGAWPDGTPVPEISTDMAARLGLCFSAPPCDPARLPAALAAIGGVVSADDDEAREWLAVAGGDALRWALLADSPLTTPIADGARALQTAWRFVNRVWRCAADAPHAPIATPAETISTEFRHYRPHLAIARLRPQWRPNVTTPPGARLVSLTPAAPILATTLLEPAAGIANLSAPTRKKDAAS